MKVLVLHNLYQQRGGEDVAVEAEYGLLSASGRYDVHLETVSNDAISGFSAQVRTFFSAPYDSRRETWATELIERTGPDVVHIHNFFPLLTPAVHHAAAEAGVAVVQTLHNFRLTCAGALLLRDGKICEKCVGGSRMWGVVHRCYRGSLPGSAALVRMQYGAEARGTWKRCVHRFIALSEFGRGKFIEAGLPADRIVVKPNFADRPDDVVPIPDRSGVVYVGRLSPEKGVDLLVEAARLLPGVPVKIVGDGPQRGALQADAPENVVFVGRLPRERVLAEVSTAACLIMPSICYEGFPMAVAEAFANGVPVVASRLGSLAEIVTADNGLHFTTGDSGDLARVVGDFLSRPELIAQLSAGALQSYRRLYTPEANIRQIDTIYRAAIDEAAKLGGRSTAAGASVPVG